MPKTRRLGLIMHGVTGRMGLNQHLIRSIAAIRADGGVALQDGSRAMPDPILVGRDPEKLRVLAAAHGIERWGTDLDVALANTEDTVFFDAGTTRMRADLLRRAIAAGKHIYCEKPTAATLADALDVARRAEAKGLKNGVVQDKLFLPGLRKLKLVIDSGLPRPGCSRCAASSATGCSKATGSRRSARPGTTARPRAAGSSSTCSATGATSLTTSSVA
jgi:Predicted dehydrogenases and related proteins